MGYKIPKQKLCEVDPAYSIFTWAFVYDNLSLNVVAMKNEIVMVNEKRIIRINDIDNFAWES